MNKQTKKQNKATQVWIDEVPFITTFKGLLGSYPKVSISSSHSFKHTRTKWGFHSLIKVLDVLALSEQKLERSTIYEVISVCGHLPFTSVPARRELFWEAQCGSSHQSQRKLGLAGSGEHSTARPKPVVEEIRVTHWVVWLLPFLTLNVTVLHTAVTPLLLLF